MPNKKNQGSKEEKVCVVGKVLAVLPNTEYLIEGGDFYISKVKKNVDPSNIDFNRHYNNNSLCLESL